MKSTVAPYEFAAWCVRIACVGGTTFRFAAYPYDLTMSNATVYQAGTGYEPTAFESTTTMAPSALDLDGFVDNAGVERADIAAGMFDEARVYVFKCDWRTPVEDAEPVVDGFLGKTTLRDGRYTIEMMSKADALGQTVGWTTSPTCPRTFGDAGCGIDLDAIKVTGALTHATSTTSFRDSSRSEAADWFAAGTIYFTSGPNAGHPLRMIQAYALDGTITLSEPTFFTPAIGDTYEMVPGCRKRASDCKDKWANKINFLGFEDLPGSNAYTYIGGTDR
jgi:uncharacterized phage protein (TIGR02218 family)